MKAWRCLSVMSDPVTRRVHNDMFGEPSGAEIVRDAGSMASIDKTRCDCADRRNGSICLLKSVECVFACVLILVSNSNNKIIRSVLFFGVLVQYTSSLQQ